MVTVRPDERRRITLTKEVAEMADEFELIMVRDEVLLIPIPKDPFAVFEREGKKIPAGLSISDLKKKAREAALKEVREEHGIR